MPDATWRTWEREWLIQQAPDSLHRALVARRRMRLPLPGAWLAQATFPARTFRSSHSLRVRAELPDGSIADLGWTPSWEPVAVPAHRVWWVEPEHPIHRARDLAVLVGELTEQQVPGLSLRETCDEVLPALTRLRSLRWLSLQGQVQGSGLAELGRLPQLRTLRIESQEALEPAALVAIPELSWLHELRLGWLRDGIGDEHLAPLSRLRHLRRLELTAPWALTGSGLRHLRGLPLEYLSLQGCPRLADEGLAHLAEQDRLEHLALLAGRSVTSRGLEYLTAVGLPRLRHLELMGRTHIGEPGLRFLDRLIALRCLRLGTVRQATQECVATLASLIELEELAVEVGDLDPSPLSALTSLQALRLGCGDGWSDPDLTFLEALPELRRLQLTRPHKELRGALRSLPQLTDLSLNTHRRACVVLPAVGRLRELRRLELLKCERTLGRTDLVHLEGLRRLVRLELHWSRSCEVPDLLVNQLRRARPDCDLEIRAGYCPCGS